jgi:glutaminyl-tRNA synthetase
MEGANRKVKGTIHWVDARTAVEAEVRLYDRLFSVPDPDDAPEGGSFVDNLNPASRQVVRAYVEAAAAEASPEQSFQFERTGYFVADRRDHAPGRPVFNRSVGLRDTWATR